MTAAPYAAPGLTALHKLPVQLRMLVRVMGEAAAYQLVQKRGGTPFTVPKRLRSEHFAQLVDLVASPVAAGALVAEMPGETLQLPKYDGVLRQLRHQRVLSLRTQGYLLAEVALQTGYTVRHVINICNASGMDDMSQQQGDLFGGGAGADDCADAAAAVQPRPAQGCPSANPSKAV